MQLRNARKEYNTRAAFYLADEGGTLHHVVGMPAAYARAVDGFAIGPTSLACGLAAYSGEPVITADVRGEPRWWQWVWMAEWFDFAAAWSFPIRSATGKVVGALAIYSRGPRPATPRRPMTAPVVAGYRASNANTALHPRSTQMPLG